METPLTTEAGENGAASAGNSNLLPFDSNRPEGATSSLPQITVFTAPTLRLLLVFSVSVMLSEVILLICQVCLIIQSRRLSVCAISAVLVIWTLLSLILTSQWVILLSSNRVAIVKRGKMLIGICQGLAVLSFLASIALLSVQMEVNKWEDENVKILVGTIFGTNCFNITKFCVIFVFIRRGQKKVHQIIGSWLWVAIQQHIERQRLLMEEGGNNSIQKHLEAVYEENELHFTADAA